jgi:4-amino-4-deoxy-L-arabinose transferase-like glycosyltransferase
VTGSNLEASEETTRGRTRWETRAYLLALAVAFVIRVVAVAGTDPREVWIRWSGSVASQPSRQAGMVWDQGLYDAFGWNLATQGVIGVGSRPSAFCMPAYPILLGGVYRMAGHLPGAARWAQVFLSVLTLVFLGAVARRLGGPRAEILAVLIGGVYPYYVYFVREILTEALFVFAFSATLLAAARAGERSGSVDHLLHGLAAAVTAMTRSVGFFLIPGTLILARPWAKVERRRRLAGVLLFLFIVAGVWGVWILRNWNAFGQPVLLDTHGGWYLYMGALYSQGLDFGQTVGKLGYQHTDILRGTFPEGSRNEQEADRRSGEKAMAIIRGDPAGFAAFMARNALGFWFALGFGDVADSPGTLLLMSLVGWISYLPVLILGLFGLARCWKTGRRDFFWAAVVLMVTTTVLHTTALGGKRYRAATLDPLLIVLAAAQASHLLSRWWRKPQAAAKPDKERAELRPTP